MKKSSASNNSTSSEKAFRIAFGWALTELLSEAAKRAGGKGRPLSMHQLLERLGKPLSQTSLNLVKSGERSPPRPGTIITTVRKAGGLAGWSQQRIEVEAAKLLVLGGYGDLPGVFQGVIDATFPKLGLLVRHPHGTPFVEEDRLRIGVVAYPPFVSEDGTEGFAVEIAKLLVDSLLGPKSGIEYVSWETPLTFSRVFELHNLLG